MKQIAAITLLIILSCCTGNINQPQKASIKFMGKYMVCDTCQTTLLIHHNECTTCGELSVDSGTVYFSEQIKKQAQALVNNAANVDSYLVSPNTIDVSQLYLADTNYFTKLWPNTNTFNDSFLVTGKIVNVKRRVLSNGEAEVYPSFYFKVNTFSAYTKVKASLK